MLIALLTSSLSRRGFAVSRRFSAQSLLTFSVAALATLVLPALAQHTAVSSQATEQSPAAPLVDNLAISVNTAPAAPTITSVTPGNGVVVVAFSAPSSDGGSAITGYTVTASPGGATATGTSSPLAVGGLTNDTAYTFTVTATNASGTGAASTASAAATPRLVTQQAYVKAVNTGAGDNLGHAVAMSGSTLVVGAPNEASNAVGVNGDTLNNSLNGAGAVYVFTRSGTTWTQQAYLKASNTGEQDQFGAAVAIAGETVVVGAPRESSSAAGVNGNQADNGTTNAGAVYVFTRGGTTWTQQAYLKASNPGVDDLFGTAVAIAGDTVVVGAYQEDSNATGVNGTQSDNSASNAGAAYVFTRSGTTWSQQAYLKASNTQAGDRFGQAVAISGETIAIGADGEDSNATGVNGTQSDNSAGSSGAVYLFTRSGTAWTQQAYLKASNTQTDDAFGRAVALAGDLLVVGADGEDSAATGANGNQADNLAGGSGAAYVFTRSGTTWTQQAYLKASNPDRDDRFGYAVAVSGEKIIVGAFYEASTASGINGNQADNSVLYTGAAYVFQRSGTGWTQQAYVKASNSTNATFFGTAVTLSGDTAVVGATRENSSAVLVGGNQSDTGATSSGAAYVFLVPTAPPAVTTPTSASVADTTATLGGNLVSGGGAAITERGIVYALTSANANPRLNGTGVTKVAASGTATGVFTTAVTDLVGNRAYTFAAYATNSAGTAYSEVGTFTTPAGAPSAPTITSVVGGDGLVVVTFTPPANDNGSPITGYTVTFQNGSGPSTVTGTSSPIVVGGLNNNTGNYYFFTVAATNALGTGPASATSDAVKPSPTAPQAYLKAANTGAGDQFGAALALSGDTLVVGAPDEDSAATGVNGDAADNTAPGSGAVYVFTRSGTTWTQQAYLKAANTGAGDKFGAAVAVAGDTLVVGAPDEASAATAIGGDAADNTAAGAGVAYVFTRSGTTWTQQAYLKAANTRMGAQFGATVAVAGDTVVVGAAREASAATGINGDAADTTAADAGAAYVFTRSGTTWTQQAYLKASNAQAGDRFGAAVALAGETLVVGATGEASAATGVDGNQADNTVAASGAAYVFTRTGTAWTQQAYLKASNSGTNDLFGSAVAISGDTVVIGASGEASDANAVNGNQADNAADNAGAAYVFTRTGTAWTQQAYLKASNSDAGDRFGWSVALADDSVVVGAWGEASRANGVNSVFDNNNTASGAAYRFQRAGTTWTQQAYIKATNTGDSDNFGRAVAASGLTLAVGAINEDSAATGVGGNQADNTAANAGAVYAYTFFYGPTVSAPVSPTIAATTATLGGTVASDGALRERGIVYARTATNAAPQIGGTGVTKIVATGTAVGDFTAAVTGLTAGTGYSYAAYAINGVGTAYSPVATFTTTADVPSAPTAVVAVSGNGFAVVQFSAPASDGGAAITSYTVTASPGGATATGTGSPLVVSGLTNGTAYTFTVKATNSTGSGAASAASNSATPALDNQQAYLKASNTAFGNTFGISLAVSGDTLVVGSHAEDTTASNSGAVYVFTRSNAAWKQEALLKASNAGTNDLFGRAVAIAGDTIIVGAYGESSSSAGVDGNQADNSASFAGAAYIFTRTGTTWTQQAYLKASNPGANDYFGHAVGIAGDTVIVGAPQEGSNATGVNGVQANESALYAGAAYIFTRSGTTWTQQAYLKASNTGEYDQFGYAVALSGDTAVVGAWREDSPGSGVNGEQTSNSLSDAGSAYIFTRSGATWTQQAYLKASSPGAEDYFGKAVAISGDTVVIGAHQEDSAATGANGNAADNSQINAGAAYVFTRSGTAWTQQAYLKASNAGPSDQFGAAVSISGDVIAIGAWGEAGSIGGINVTQTDDGSLFAGATYVWTRSGSTWTQRAYLKASNARGGDQFGSTVAVSGGTVVASSPLERSAAVGVNGNQFNTSAQDAGAAFVFFLPLAPSVSASTATAVAPSTATLGGEVTADNGAAVTERGIVYAPTATNAAPRLGGTGVVKVAATGTATGAFTVDVTGLAAVTGYSYSAYATNAVGTGYSPAATFTTGAANPTVASVAVPAAGTRKLGDTLDFTVNWSAAVDVVTTGGTPALGLTVGSAARTAGYVSGSGTTATVFRYTVQASDLDTNGIALGALTLNGGTIKDTAANDAVLTLAAVGSTASVNLDGVAPAAPVITGLADDTGTSATDGITKDTTLVLNGTAEANATVTLSKAGNVIGTTTANGTGVWSFDYTATTLGSGDHSFTATATDAAGNTGATSATYLVTIDTAIAAPVIAAITTDSGTSATDGITSDNTLVLNGTADANTTVTVLRNGVGAIGTATTNATGAWSFDYTATTLADAVYLFTATATDAAGNTSAASADFPVTIDTAAPVITASTAAGTFQAAFSYTIATTGAAVSTTAAPLPAGLTLDPATGTISGTPTAAGDTTVALTATDTAGNIGTATLTISIAKLTPVIAWATPAGLTYGTALTATELNATASVPGTFVYTPAAGSTPLAGNQTLSAAFTPTDTANYHAVPVTSVTLAVAQRDLTVAGLTAVPRDYNGTLVAALTGTPSLVGVLPADIATVTLAGTATGAFATTAIGLAKPVTVTGLTLAGAAAPNYLLVQPTGLTATISAKNLTVAGATATGRRYDGTTAAALVFTGASLVGVVSPDVVTLNSAAAVGTFSNANAGLGKLVTITGLTLGGAGAGSYTVTQPTATANISPADATLAITNLAQTYDGTAKSATVTTTPGGVALGIVYANAGGVAPTAAGSYLVTANVTNPNYSGNANATLVIAQAPQTIAFAAPAGTPALGTPVTLAATATSGLPVTFTVVSGPATVAGSALTFTGSGTAVVRANQLGNENYLPAAPVTASLTSAARTAQTIAFAPLGNKLTTDAAFTLAASASSGLPVTFSLVSGPATLSGNTLTLTGAAGAVTLRASQAGNGAFLAAPDVTQSFNVLGRAVQQVFFGLTQNNDNLAVALAPDGKSGTLICFLAATGEAFIVDFTINPDGTFAATVTALASTAPDARALADTGLPPRAAAPATRTFSGRLVNGALTGSIAELGLSFSAAVQPTAGPTAAISGLYKADTTNTATGSAYTIVSSQGQVFALAVTPTTVAAGTGTVAADNTFAIQASGNTAISGTIDALTAGVTGTVSNATSTQSFTGASSAIARTDRLINLSSRVRISAAAARTLITGFVIGGTAEKRVLLRAVGPALTGFGVTGALVNPKLTLFNATGTVLLENDDWSGADTATAFAQTGAFTLAAGARDAALVTTLAPGAYTMQVTAGAESGAGLAEVYDASPTANTDAQRLVNLSTRGTVEPGTDGLLIGGFVVTGNAPKRVLIRGIGPALGAFGVAGTLADPRLAVYSGATLVAQNDDWSVPAPLDARQTAATAAELTAAAQSVGAFALGTGAKDAAILLTLAPGAYTAQVSATTTGTALVEIYEVP